MSAELHLHGIASSKPEFSPCIILKSGSQTVAALFVIRPLSNGGSGRRKCSLAEHSITWPVRDLSFRKRL